MLSFLDRLRAKPPAARQRVALLSAVSVTLVITAVWAISLPARFSPETTSQSASTPFASLGGAIRDQWNTVRNSFPSASTTPASPTVTDTPPVSSDSTTTNSTTSRIQFGEIDTSESAVDYVPVATPPPVMILIATTTDTATSE